MTILLSILLMIMVQSTGEENSSAAQSPPVPAGMVWVDGGEFTMGGVGSEVRPDELPRHRVRLDGFFISETEVTNRQFKAFIDATGYQTVAERAVDWEEIRKQVPPGTPKPPDEISEPVVVVAASAVPIAVGTPVTFSVPPMLAFSATPRPPAVISAPLVAVVDVVVACVTMLPPA